MGSGWAEPVLFYASDPNPPQEPPLGGSFLAVAPASDYTLTLVLGKCATRSRGRYSCLSSPRTGGLVISGRAANETGVKAYESPVGRIEGERNGRRTPGEDDTICSSSGCLRSVQGAF